MRRLLFDGRPCRVVGWGDDDGRPVVDLEMEDGTAKWTFWPSPRLQLEEKRMPIADSNTTCDNCGADCTRHFIMCDREVNDVPGREAWCPPCFDLTPCGRGEHGEGCPTGTFSDGEKG